MSEQAMSATERDWKPDDVCSICGKGIPLIWDWESLNGLPVHHDCVLRQRLTQAEAALDDVKKASGMPKDYPGALVEWIAILRMSHLLVEKLKEQS